jgi:hypothetical protein
MKESKKVEPKFWDCDDSRETLVHTDRDDAIRYYLDGLDGPVREFPEMVEVYGFAPKDKPTVDAEISPGGPLEQFLDDLHEEYGWPEDDPYDPSKAMIEAERVFVETVLREYVVHQCEQVACETVNVMDWIRDHEPGWLEEGETS